MFLSRCSRSSLSSSWSINNGWETFSGRECLVSDTTERTTGVYLTIKRPCKLKPVQEEQYLQQTPFIFYDHQLGLVHGDSVPRLGLRCGISYDCASDQLMRGLADCPRLRRERSAFNSIAFDLRSKGRKGGWSSGGRVISEECWRVSLAQIIIYCSICIHVFPPIVTLRS